MERLACRPPQRPDAPKASAQSRARDPGSQSLIPPATPGRRLLSLASLNLHPGQQVRAPLNEAGCRTVTRPSKPKTLFCGFTTHSAHAFRGGTYKSVSDLLWTVWENLILRLLSNVGTQLAEVRKPSVQPLPNTIQA